jgi:hypothetical protein
MLMIVYFMFIEIHSLFKLKWKYFSQFWSYVELGIIICSWTTVGVYIWRYKESNRIGQLFKQTDGYVYINLQLAAYVNDLLTFLFAFCCFFGTIEFARLCRFNQRLSLFNQTLQNARNDLGHFSFMFSLLFIAFICLFHFLFLSSIQSCSTFLRTAQMLFEMSLSKFNAKELITAAPFLGPFAFSLFIILIVFICMGIFLSIINDSFRLAQEKETVNAEIYSYMLKKFLRWSRIRKPTELELAEERDTTMRSKYIDPIDYLPDKFDELIETLDKNFV